MSLFDVSQLDLKVHENRNYPADEVRYFEKYLKISCSVSGQYGSRNVPKLIELITSLYQGEKVYFVDTRHDTHFELNSRPASLKRILLNDDNTGLKGEEVIAKEKKVAEFFVDKIVTFIPKEPHGGPWDEKVTHCAIIKDYIEDPKWNNRHIFMRFALSEHGPMTDVQVDEFLLFLKKVDSEGAWLHTNSLVGGAAAILLIVLKSMLQNPKDELKDIISKYEGASKFLDIPKDSDENRQAKIDRTAFIREFYEFAKTRNKDQSWSDWKAKQK